MTKMHLNGRPVDYTSLRVEGVCSADYPDFCDAYWDYGTYEDGTELTCEELEQLVSDYPGELNQDAFEAYI